MNNNFFFHIITIIASVLVATLVALATSTEETQLYDIPIIYLCAGLSFVVHWAIAIPALITKSEKYFDLTGMIATLLTITTAMVALLNSGVQISIKSIIVASFVSIWTLRLGLFLFSRIIKSGEDKRFREIKGTFSRFFMTWTLSALWVFLTIINALTIIIMLVPTVNVVLCMSDIIALELLHMALEMGIKVPQELKITGFDGIELWGVHARHLSEQPGLDGRWLKSQGLAIPMVSDYLPLESGEQEAIRYTRDLCRLARHWQAPKVRTFAGHQGSAELDRGQRQAQTRGTSGDDEVTMFEHGGSPAASLSWKSDKRGLLWMVVVDGVPNALGDQDACRQRQGIGKASRRALREERSTSPGTLISATRPRVASWHAVMRATPGPSSASTAPAASAASTRVP